MNAVYTHVLTPFPAEIEQRESQQVLLNANLYVATPYATKSQVRVKALASRVGVAWRGVLLFILFYQPF